MPEMIRGKGQVDRILRRGSISMQHQDSTKISTGPNAKHILTSETDRITAHNLLRRVQLSVVYATIWGIGGVSNGSERRLFFDVLVRPVVEQTLHTVKIPVQYSLFELQLSLEDFELRPFTFGSLKTVTKKPTKNNTIIPTLIRNPSLVDDIGVVQSEESNHDANNAASNRLNRSKVEVYFQCLFFNVVYMKSFCYH